MGGSPPGARRRSGRGRPPNPTTLANLLLSTIASTKVMVMLRTRRYYCKQSNSARNCDPPDLLALRERNRHCRRRCGSRLHHRLHPVLALSAKEVTVLERSRAGVVL